MKKNYLMTVMLILAAGSGAVAQKLSLKSGSVDALKGQKIFLVAYDYSNLGVGKFDREEDYVAQRVAELNKDEAGSGDKWKEAWYNDRPSRFEPKFEELFNTALEDKGVTCSQDAKDAKYEILVHTTFVEPGYNVGISRKDATIDATVTIRERQGGGEVAVITVDNCPGRLALGFDFDTGQRIAEAYALLGRTVGRYLLKSL